MFSKRYSTFVALSIALSAQGQSQVWGQCGGIGWSGPTTCVAGSTCTVSNAYYSQCLPGSAPPATTPPPTTTAAPTTTPAAPPTTAPATTTPGTGSSSGSCPAIASTSSYNNANLPDPFTFTNGSPVKTKADWACRAAEISQLLQQDELGTFPGPPTSVTASLSGSTLTINVSANGKSMSFAPTISLPTTGTAPFPALIALDGGSLPKPAGVAIISFNTEDMAAQDSSSSRGQGKFYTLFGSNASAGATLAWAWGIARVIDALEITPAAKIDTTRIGVTGCSRDGKGALVAGAFEPRIVLTIPQESGSGGTDCWRLSDYLLKNGLNTQTASEIIGENVWFSTNFNQFAQSSTNKLPFDHHLLAGMIAPRGLFAIDNIGYDWLGAWASWGCMKSAQTIWQALGASDSMGVSQSSNHSHCVFPSSQQSQLDAFIGRFLLKQSTNTAIVQTAGNATFPSTWDSWTTPTLT